MRTTSLLTIYAGMLLLSACVSIDSASPEERLQAVEDPRFTDQVLLAKIMREDKDWDVKFAAIRKLTDQTLLAQLAVEAEDVNVRNLAVEKVTSQTILAQVAVEDEHSSTRYIAVDKLTDQAVLTKIAMEEKDLQIRALALERLTDKDAFGHTDFQRQMISAKKIVASKDFYDAVRLVDKLTHQEALALVAVESTETRTRTRWIYRSITTAHSCYSEEEEWIETIGDIAVKGITDQAILAQVVIDAGDVNVRRAVVEKLTDQATLAQVAVNDEALDIRKMAIDKLTDQEQIGNVVVNAKDSPARYAAFKKLTDQKVLGSVIAESEDSYVRYLAIQKLTDQPLLLHIVENGKTWKERRQALAKRANHSETEVLALNALDDNVRATHVENVSSPFILLYIAYGDGNADVRLAAVTNEHFTDQDALVDISRNDESESVREAAIKRVQ